MDLAEITSFLSAHRGLAGGLLVAAAGAAGAFLARRARWVRPDPSGPRALPLLLATLAFVAAAAAAAHRPPLAAVHDEFSYLLAADTYAAGRLANPSPPSPEHFETFHVLVEPTYASKYPPAQGLALAAGRILLGHPAAGLWLSAAAFAAALAWALAARLSAGWVGLWGLLAVARFASTGYWAQSYWGGLLAATGGALVLGAALRLAQRTRALDGLLLGLGSGLLALSRPFEGLVLCAVAHLWLVRRLLARRAPARPLLGAALPWAAALVLALGLQARVNAAVTGDPFTLPYQLHEQRYAAAPTFLLEPPLERPTYTSPELERFWTGWTLAEYERRRAAGPAAVLLEKLDHYGSFFVGWAWLPFLLIGLAARGGALARWSLVAGLAAVGVETFDNEHYAAPFTAAVVLACATGTRRLAASEDPRRRGALACALPALGLVALVDVAAGAVGWRPSWPERRAELIGDLEALPGRDLVFVRVDLDGLPPDAQRHWENVDWVYGGADLAGAEVVFARDLGSRRNAELAAALGPRRAWRLVLPAALAGPRVLDALVPVEGP